MKRRSTSIFWTGMAFGVALGLAAAVLAIKGIQAKGIVRALQITARWSFLLFWLAYSAGAMCELFGPALAPFARHGRELGLAYAAAQLIHLGLVIWLFQISTRPPLSGGLFAFFVIAIVWTYLLAFLSFGGLAEALGTRSWRILRVLGLNYILFAFAFDFVPPVIWPGPGPYGLGRLVQYVPFAAMSIVAPLLVLAAAAHRYQKMRSSPASPGAVADAVH